MFSAYLKKMFFELDFKCLCDFLVGEKEMKKRLLALLFSGVLAVSMLSGCSTEIDKTAIVATGTEKEISLGVANFAARLTQAQYDDFYVSYFGEEVWRTDMYGNGVTMEDDVKTNVMSGLYAMYALQNHMADYGVEITEEDVTAIRTAAEAFISANSSKALEALGADKEIVETYLTLLTIENRMHDEIIKGADTNVSDEEARTSSYSQVYISTTSYTDEEGNSVEYSEEELEELAQTVKEFGEDAKEKGLETAAESYGYNVTNGTYNADSSLTEEIKTALSAMTTDGAVSDVIETENGYYVVQMNKVLDEAATESNRQTIISERQNEYYTSIVDGYVEAMDWSLDEKLWRQVSFDNLFITYLEETEIVEGTEILE